MHNCAENESDVNIKTPALTRSKINGFFYWTAKTLLNVTWSVKESASLQLVSSISEFCREWPEFLL